MLLSANMSLSDEQKIQEICNHIRETNKVLKQFDDTFNKSTNLIKDEIFIKDVEINELKPKINNSIYLTQGEKLVSIIFRDEEKDLTTSVFCKNTDKFLLAFKKLSDRYEQINLEDYDLFCNKIQIDLDKTFDENGLKNGDKVNLIKKQKKNEDEQIFMNFE